MTRPWAPFVCLVVALTGAGCAYTAPTSAAPEQSTPPVGSVATDPADTVTVPASELVAEPNDRTPPEPKPRTVTSNTDMSDTATSNTDMSDTDVSDTATSDRVTDEPSFEVEPARPFEVRAAELAPPSGPGLDDAGDEQPTGWGAFDANLDAALLQNGNTAASVAVSIGGDVVHARGFGARAPLFSAEITDTDDRFRIASISKVITAITLLRLVEDGTVGLDDEVGGLIADQLGVTPSAAGRLTVRQLLGHRSGFGKFDSQFFRGGAGDCNDAARQGMQRGAGGGGYVYSNMNFCVAGILIEALTGESYVTVVYEQLLTPLGLSGMRLANTFDPGPDEVLHVTTPGRNYMETLGAAGSWIAAPSDLVTILDSLDASTPGFKPLSPEMVVLMETPGGAQFGQRGYGLGLISYGDGRFGHTGTIESTHAMVMNRGDGVIWAITVAGPYPDDTPRLEAIINRAFEAAGFISE